MEGTFLHSLAFLPDKPSTSPSCHYAIKQPKGKRLNHSTEVARRHWWCWELPKAVLNSFQCCKVPMQLAKCNRRSTAMLHHRPHSTSAIPPSEMHRDLWVSTCNRRRWHATNAAGYDDMINTSMWLRRIPWQLLRYHDFSWAASAVLMQSKLKQWKQQQTTANLGIDKSEQRKLWATWRRLRHMMAWSMMIYMWYDMIWSAKIVPHLEMPLATQMQHSVSGLSQLVASGWLATAT